MTRIIKQVASKPGEGGFEYASTSLPTGLAEAREQIDVNTALLRTIDH